MISPKTLFKAPYAKTKVLLGVLMGVVIVFSLAAGLATNKTLPNPPADEILGVKNFLAPVLGELDLMGASGILALLGSMFAFFFQRGENQALKQATGQGLFEGYRENFLDKMKTLADKEDLDVFVGRPTLALKKDPKKYVDAFFENLSAKGFAHQKVNKSNTGGPREYFEISKKVGRKNYKVGFDIPTTLFSSHHIGRVFSDEMGNPIKTDEEPALFTEASDAFFKALKTYRENEVKNGGFIEVVGEGNNHAGYLADAFAEEFDRYFNLS